MLKNKISLLFSSLLPSLFLSLQKMEFFVGSFFGKKRYLISLFLGAVASYAMPPWGYIFTFAFAIILLFWQLNTLQTFKQAVALGAFFGFGFFATGMLWINNALLLYAEEFAFLVLPFTIFIGCWGAIFWAVPTLVAFVFKKGIPRILAFASVFSFMEWVRSWLFSGLPWNLTASIWNEENAIMQTLALIGPYGLGILTLTLFASFSLAPEIPKAKKTNIAFIGGMVAIFAILGVWGQNRLDENENSMTENVKIRMVQPAIPQKLKWSREETFKNFQTYLNMSEKDLGKDITHIIWGETATTFPLHNDRYNRAKIARILPENVTLITGTIKGSKNNNGQFEIFNNVAVVSSSGNVVGGYDKSHLVPFGEYTPFKGFIPINEITSGLSGDFTAGRGVETITIPNATKAGILICYEIIFPAEVVNKSNRPDWLINLTNDAWYGISSGPYQHLVSAKMRAIEEGLPIVRVANSGISAVINPYGEIIAKIPLNTVGILDTGLPLPLKPTFYALYGNTISLILCLICFLLACSSLVNFKKS